MLGWILGVLAGAAVVIILGFWLRSAMVHKVIADWLQFLPAAPY